MRLSAQRGKPLGDEGWVERSQNRSADPLDFTIAYYERDAESYKRGPGIQVKPK